MKEDVEQMRALAYSLLGLGEMMQKGARLDKLDNAAYDSYVGLLRNCISLEEQLDGFKKVLKRFIKEGGNDNG